MSTHCEKGHQFQNQKVVNIVLTLIVDLFASISVLLYVVHIAKEKKRMYAYMCVFPEMPKTPTLLPNFPIFEQFLDY